MSPAQARNRILESRRVGVKHLRGNAFLIEDRLERQQLPGKKPVWVVLRGLCDGVPESHQTFHTLTMARIVWDHT